MTKRFRALAVKTGACLVSIVSIVAVASPASADIIVNGSRPKGGGGGTRTLPVLVRVVSADSKDVAQREISADGFGETPAESWIVQNWGKIADLINTGKMLYNANDGTFTTTPAKDTVYTPSGFATDSGGSEWVLMDPVR